MKKMIFASKDWSDIGKLDATSKYNNALARISPEKHSMDGWCSHCHSVWNFPRVLICLQVKSTISNHKVEYVIDGNVYQNQGSRRHRVGPYGTMLTWEGFGQMVPLDCSLCIKRNQRWFTIHWLWAIGMMLSLLNSTLLIHTRKSCTERLLETAHISTTTTLRTTKFMQMRSASSLGISIK